MARTLLWCTVTATCWSYWGKPQSQSEYLVSVPRFELGGRRLTITLQCLSAGLSVTVVKPSDPFVVWVCPHSTREMFKTFRPALLIRCFHHIKQHVCEGVQICNIFGSMKGTYPCLLCSSHSSACYVNVWMVKLHDLECCHVSADKVFVFCSLYTLDVITFIARWCLQESLLFTYYSHFW
jgi:hypothetical protein